jgi:hypothetical protein
VVHPSPIVAPQAGSIAIEKTRVALAKSTMPHDAAVIKKAKFLAVEKYPNKSLPNCQHSINFEHKTECLTLHGR